MYHFNRTFSLSAVRNVRDVTLGRCKRIVQTHFISFFSQPLPEGFPVPRTFLCHSIPFVDIYGKPADPQVRRPPVSVFILFAAKISVSGAGSLKYNVFRGSPVLEPIPDKNPERKNPGLFASCPGFLAFPFYFFMPDGPQWPQKALSAPRSVFRLPGQPGCLPST